MRARPLPRNQRRAGNAAGFSAQGEYAALVVSVNTTGWKALQQFLVVSQYNSVSRPAAHRLGF